MVRARDKERTHVVRTCARLERRIERTRKAVLRREKRGRKGTRDAEGNANREKRGKQGARSSIAKRKETKRHKKGEEQKRAKRGDARAAAQPSASRRLAICVVFYDNYKYGRKALCLEQLVRLSKLGPYPPRRSLARSRGGCLGSRPQTRRSLAFTRWSSADFRVPGFSMRGQIGR